VGGGWWVGLTSDLGVLIGSLESSMSACSYDIDVRWNDKGVGRTGGRAVLTAILYMWIGCRVRESDM